MKRFAFTIGTFVLVAIGGGLAPSRGSGVEIPARLAPIAKTAEPFVGVTYHQIVEPCCDGRTGILPRPVAVHVVEIDPTAPAVRFFGSPGNGDAPHEFTRRTTGEFVESSGVALAVNGDFYGTETGANSDVAGLAVSNGEVASAAATDGTCPHSLVLSKDGHATIVSDGSTPAGAWNAVSGNQRILEGGKIVAPDDKYTRTLNPHTAAGIDADSGHVFLLVVDGRQDKFSEGLRTDEIAAILAEFGVDDAINLDGGGSTTLVFADGEGGAPRTVNSPSDGSTSLAPGRQRQVANHLGVFAQPNPQYRPLPTPARPSPRDLAVATVDVLPNEHFATLQAALDAAPAGATVRLVPGKLRERIMIAKSVTLVGAGPDKTILGPSHEDMRSLRDRIERSVATVDRLQRKFEESRRNGEPDQDFPAAKRMRKLYQQIQTDDALYTRPVVVVKGTVDVRLKELTITMPDAPQEDAGLRVCSAVEVDAASVTLQHCDVLHCLGEGVNLKGAAHVTLDRCLVAACWGGGVTANATGTDDATLRLVNCDIRNNYHYNVAAGVGRCNIESCRVSGSAWSGISVGGPQVRVARSVIHDNARSGIYTVGAAGVVEHCLIVRNGNAASCWGEDAPRYTSNLLADNRDAAVFVSGPGRPTFQRNLLVGSPLGIAYGPMRTAAGMNPVATDFLLVGNVFWNVAEPLATKASLDPAAPRKAINLAETQNNTRANPQFTLAPNASPTIGDRGIVGQLQLEPVLALSTKSPWPLTDAEQSVIPKDGGRDSEKWQMRPRAE